MYIVFVIRSDLDLDYQWTIIAWILAVGAARVERHSAYAACVVVGDPFPHGNA